MAQLSKDVIGKKLDPFEFTVERGKIKELALAIGDNNPIYFDIEEAKKQGYKDCPAPLTFPTVFMFWGYPKLWEDMQSIGIDLGRLLHAKEEYNYEKILYPGQKVKGLIEVSDVKVGKMNMVTFQCNYLDENDEVLVIGKFTIIIRPEGT